MYAHSSFPDPVLLRCCFPQLCPIVLRAHCKFPKHFPNVLRAQSSIAIPPTLSNCFACPVQYCCFPPTLSHCFACPVQYCYSPQPCPNVLRAQSSIAIPPNPVQMFCVPSPVLLFPPTLSKCFAWPVQYCCFPSTLSNCFACPVQYCCFPPTLSPFFYLRAQSSIAVFPQPCPIVLRAHFNFPQPCLTVLRAHSSVAVFPRPCQETNLLSRCFAPQTKMCDLGSHCVMTETNCTSYPCMASPTCIREFRLTVLKTPQFVYCLILFRCSTCSVSAVPLLHVLLARCTQRLHISRSFILLFLT